MLDAQASCDFVRIWGSTLHHIDDLPYDPHEYFPHTYGFMRKKQDHLKVRPLVDSPAAGSLPFIDLNDADDLEKEAAEFIPDLQTHLGFT